MLNQYFFSSNLRITFFTSTLAAFINECKRVTRQKRLKSGRQTGESKTFNYVHFLSIAVKYSTMLKIMFIQFQAKWSPIFQKLPERGQVGGRRREAETNPRTETSELFVANGKSAEVWGREGGKTKEKARRRCWEQKQQKEESQKAKKLCKG